MDNKSWKETWLKEKKMSYTKTESRPRRKDWDDLIPDEINDFEEKLSLENKMRAELSTLKATDAISDCDMSRIAELEYKLGLTDGSLTCRRDKELEEVSGEKIPYAPRDVMRLHMELVHYSGEKPDHEQLEVLKRYGEVKYGDTITRDIIVPSDIPLYALHYVIQRLFGWQNSHLHKFSLPNKINEKITGGTVKQWLKYVGIIYRSLEISDEDVFWADDYFGGSFKVWMTKKYTGPYRSCCFAESYYESQLEMSRVDDGDYYVRYLKIGDKLEPVSACPIDAIRRDDLSEIKNRTDEHAEVLRFEDVPLVALMSYFERNPYDLLERLPISCLISPEYSDVDPKDLLKQMKGELRLLKKSGISEPSFQCLPVPMTDTLVYHYDYGDGWCINIRAMYDCADLVKQGRLSQKEIDRLNIKCRELYRPVTLAIDGEMLLDDVGGIGGYIQFLQSINPDLESMNEEQKRYAKQNEKEYLEWAKMQEWRKLSPVI